MFGAPTTVVLCSAALLVACEPVSDVSEQDVGSSIPTMQQRGAVASSAVGGGHHLFEGQMRNFSFTALEQGGIVTGQFEATNRFRGARAHGIITCFLIVGANANEAVIGGMVTQGPLQGQERVFRVVDNRPPVGTPDEISLLHLPGTGILARVADAAEYCDPNLQNRPDLPLRNITRGNITVRDNPPNAPN